MHKVQWIYILDHKINQNNKCYLNVSTCINSDIILTTFGYYISTIAFDIVINFAIDTITIQ